MCFDIDVTKLSLEELRDTLRRITMVLSKPIVVNNLPDKGHQLRLVKEKLENEIRFREGLETTHKEMQRLSLRCASEANLVTPHSSKLCSIEKKPEHERFKPHLTLKLSETGKTQSMNELHSGTKLIDLTTSLSLQKQQEERVKAEQVKAKHERLMALMKGYNAGNDDSDSDDTPPDFILSDLSEYEEDSQDEELLENGDEPKTAVKQVRKEVIFVAESKVKEEVNFDEPGPSHIKRKVLKKESNTLEKKIQSISDTVELKTEAMELKKEPEKSEKQVQLDYNSIELKADTVKLEKEPEEPMEAVQPNVNTDITGLKAEAEELKKESSNPKDEADMA